MIPFSAGIREYTRNVSKTLNAILNDNNELSHLIKFLKENYKIKYVTMMQKFGISKNKINSLSK